MNIAYREFSGMRLGEKVKHTGIRTSDPERTGHKDFFIEISAP